MRHRIRERPLQQLLDRHAIHRRRAASKMPGQIFNHGLKPDDLFGDRFFGA